MKSILLYFPEHTCYVEPFAGGASLLFAKERAKCEVLNDKNGELMNLYRVVQHHLDTFVDHFAWMLSSRENFNRNKEADPSQLTDIQRAVMFYYQMKHVFGGQAHRQYFGTSTTSPTKFDSHQSIRNLQAACARLKQVYIEHQPWEKVVDIYDRKETLIYADPPYYQTAAYGVPFTWEEYEKLKEKMLTVKGMMILSINDHPDIRALFKGFNIVELKTAYSVGGTHKPAKELLILNSAVQKCLAKRSNK